MFTLTGRTPPLVVIHIRIVISQGLKEAENHTITEVGGSVFHTGQKQQQQQQQALTSGNI